VPAIGRTQRGSGASEVFATLYAPPGGTSGDCTVEVLDSSTLRSRPFRDHWRGERIVAGGHSAVRRSLIRLYSRHDPETILFAALVVCKLGCRMGTFLTAALRLNRRRDKS
jgi:hypothetical protein